MKSIIIFTLSVQLCFANDFTPEISMIRQINKSLYAIPKIGDRLNCGEQIETSGECSKVLSDYIENVESQGLFKLFIEDSPREMCSGVVLNDDFFTEPSKLDNYFQKYTSNLVPSFFQTNSGCLSNDKIGLTGIRDQRDLISYYYYANMRILNDSILSLNSLAALDKSLGRPILSDVDCKELGEVGEYCNFLKKCPNTGKDDLDSLVVESSLALDVVASLKDKTSEEEIEQIEIGLERLYPWLNGKEFKKSLMEKDDKYTVQSIKTGLKNQFEVSRKKTLERLRKHKKLSGCVNANTLDCDNFQQDLNELVEHTPISDFESVPGLIARSYENRQSCINNQTVYRDSANASINDLLIGSGLTIATMGLGSIAVGSGHLFKSALLSSRVTSTSVRAAPYVKSGAKVLGASIAGSMAIKGINDAISNCDKYLNHLEYITNISPPNESFCPMKSSDPHMQVMADYKSCIIESALVSIDFIPGVSLKVPEFMKKIRLSRSEETYNQILSDDVLMQIDPDNMKLRSLREEYELEEVGDSMMNLGTRKNGKGELVRSRTFYIKTDKRREPYRAFIKDGKLYASNGKLFNSSTTMLDKEFTLRTTFVIDKNGRLFLHPKPDVGRIHHSTIVGGEDVLSAGELIVKDGVVLEIFNRSGHYKPEDVHFYQGIYLMMKEGLDFSKLKKYPDPNVR
ncbi:hypothetical protein [Bacteriovorax sp. Seq25_V]|uniref:hypothetical protein n=1 Tax=Bacteriovorax sp. Seq25_V TaxID=1201288 RepID=UPI000389E84F|nr:hypothetical protein [Bacteriovorax sp. Seq25_V]EQC47174.1 hypothetical protein M900_0971 [Bacteriovorax sp. Seq25_V]